jgi:hypothetical protein
MTVLDRVKERTESDLSDAELQNLIDEAVQDITIKVGPVADSLNPIVVLLDGQREKIVLLRAIDTTETIVVTEQWDSLMGMSTVTLTANDYRIWPGGFTLERRFDGLTDIPRRQWGDRVQIVYTPVDDSIKRDEVTIKLVTLSLQYDGFTSQTIGDFQGTLDDYNALRGKLIESISPRSGMLML